MTEYYICKKNNFLGSYFKARLMTASFLTEKNDYNYLDTYVEKNEFDNE